MFIAYNQLVAEQGIRGDVLEIGVHHGLSAVAIAALRGPGCRFVAIDLFDHLQALNSSRSGCGSESAFIRTMSRFYGDLDFLEPVARRSDEIEPLELGCGFSFCHIDGGHSCDETYRDLCLCAAITTPGGLIGLDDYFNPSFPGVCEGGVKFCERYPELLRPVAVGFDKVLFQKLPAPFRINEVFSKKFPTIGHSTVAFWEQPAYLFGSGFQPFVDISKSTPLRLHLLETFVLGARLEPQALTITAAADSVIKLPVRVTNNSSIAFAWGSTSFAVSYHLLTDRGDLLAFDNPRTVFREPLAPNHCRTVELIVAAPAERGRYLLEIDIVWEGVTWLHDKGSKTARVELLVV